MARVPGGERNRLRRRPSPGRREGGTMFPRRLRLALLLAGAFATQPTASSNESAAAFDPLLSGNALCGSPAAGRPVLLHGLLLAATETAPFQPQPVKPAVADAPMLYDNLGNLAFEAGTRSGKSQAWFNQGMRLAFAFNHAEAQRAFREAQKADPRCALCFWGEALVLGPNINAPMSPEANAAALAALAKAVELAPAAPARDRALIEA